MHKIVLSNGYTLDHLELNGNNYIAPGIVDDAVFDGNLDSVTVTDQETGVTETWADMTLGSNRDVDGRSWLVFVPVPEEYKLRQRIAELETAINLLISGATEVPS